jgi:hypothetical protein
MITRQDLDEVAVLLGPSLLMEDCGFAPDDWQRRVLRSSANRLLICANRQAGKSTVAAVLGLHAALFDPGALVVLVSPTLRQSGELFRKITGAYSRLGRPIPRAAESATTLELAHGSRVVSLPGSPETIRGFSAVDLLVVDEAARVTDAMFAAVSPMLAVSGGRLVLISSPRGARGYFHEQFTTPGDLLERHMITS